MLPLDGDRCVTGLFIFRDGTETTIKPTPVEPKQPGHPVRQLSVVRITPQSRQLQVTAHGKSNNQDHVSTIIKLGEHAGKAKAEIMISASVDEQQPASNFRFGINSLGRITTLKVFRDGVYRLLGLPADPELSDTNRILSISDPSEQQKLFAAAGEALGFNGSDRIDLSLTASGLYAALGNRHLDPVHELVSI